MDLLLTLARGAKRRRAPSIRLLNESARAALTSRHRSTGPAQPSPAAPGRYAPRLPAGLSREGAPQKSGGSRGPRRLPSQPHTEVREEPGIRPLVAKPRPQRRGGGKPAASSGPAAAHRARRAAPGRGGSAKRGKKGGGSRCARREERGC